MACLLLCSCGRAGGNEPGEQAHGAPIGTPIGSPIGIPEQRPNLRGVGTDGGGGGALAVPESPAWLLVALGLGAICLVGGWRFYVDVARKAPEESRSGT